MTSTSAHRSTDRAAGSQRVADRKRHVPRLPDRSRLRFWTTFILVILAILPSACTRFYPPPIQRDMAAERVVARLKQINAGLVRFKCVAKMTLTGSRRPLQSFRTAMAGALPDRLRIDLFAPFGGSAGAVSSDGKHLFVVMFRSHEYYKRRLGSGNLHRLLDMDITVEDLLELLVGRIPMDADRWARLMPGEDGNPPNLVLRDRWGRTRQRIIFDAAGRPVRSTWFDSRHHLTFSVAFSGRQEIGGFVLPQKIDLSAPSGRRIAVVLDRYMANVAIDDSIFVLPRLPA